MLFEIDKRLFAYYNNSNQRNEYDHRI